MEAACHPVFDEATKRLAVAGRGALTEGQITVVCVETFFGEVCNGGLQQYLINQSPTASACANALRRVGLAAYAEIIEQTLQICTNRPALNEFGELEDDFWLPDFETDDDFPLKELDTRFFEFYFAEEDEFRRHLFQYVIDHESEFVNQP
jgi:hypothetical protein